MTLPKRSVAPAIPLQGWLAPRTARPFGNLIKSRWRFALGCEKCGEVYYHGDAHKCLPRPKPAKPVKSAEPLPHKASSNASSNRNAK